MNNELLAILNHMERERGIDREILMQSVESALQSALFKRNADNLNDLRVEVDRTTCDIRAFVSSEVVESTGTNKSQISLAEAKKINPEINIGDVVDVEINPDKLGRIAAQTAKQAIVQKIRRAEKDIVFDEYKDRIGEIISGTVRQFVRNDIIVDLGRAEAVIPMKERVPTEEYQPGDRIRGYVVDVQNNSSGSNITISRSHPDFVKKLFNMEVSEIADGIVEIKGIAREPGYRTKIAVTSNDSNVDPVGSCVGMRGLRVKNIVRELSGEKIDIIRWSEDTKTYVTNALAPAKLLKVMIDTDNPRIIHVITDADQLSLAIGKRGQNVRLTAKLLGLKIDIQKDERDVSFEEKVEKAIEGMACIDGVSHENAKSLVNAGFLTVEGLLMAEVSDVEEMAGLDSDTAQAVYEAVEAYQSKKDKD